MMEVLSLLLGVAVVLAITAVTGYFVAQEFAYMAVDRSQLNARAAAGDAAAERHGCIRRWSPECRRTAHPPLTKRAMSTSHSPRATTPSTGEGVRGR